MNQAVYESSIPGLTLLHRGKVRDVYAVDDKHLLIVTSDRLSAFDVVFPDPIPDKGRILNRISNFWFDRTAHLGPNHRASRPLAPLLRDLDATTLAPRSVLVRRLEPLPIEAVVRGYLIGSGWKDYRRDGRVCGIELPRGLTLADRLPRAIYTPATKAAPGEHDENIDFETSAKIVGRDVAERVRERALALYAFAADYAASRGIIIADTKFEFATDESGALVLIDEALTPDSSRFWPQEDYSPGVSPPSYDKQYVRDYVERLGWDKRPPAPELPPDVIRRTSAKYREAERRLLGESA